MSRHDAWVWFRNARRDEFNLAGVPEWIWFREVRLKRFLSAGHVEGQSAELACLTDEQFLRLERLVDEFYPDLGDFDGFTVHLKERLRRFGRYGPAPRAAAD